LRLEDHPRESSSFCILGIFEIRSLGSQGDIVFCDALEGIVAIPKDLVDDVIDLMPKLVHADEKVKEDVQAGSSVFEAFKKHRS
jgi:hypothetical protein